MHDSYSLIDANSNLKLIPDIDAIIYTDYAPQGLPLIQSFRGACTFSHVSTSYVALISLEPAEFIFEQLCFIDVLLHLLSHYRA